MKKYLIITSVLIITLIIISGCQKTSKKKNSNSSNKVKEETYNPKINPDDFVDTIDNKYFTLTPGTKFIYENKIDEGLERIEVVITEEKKDVLGVTNIVVWDRAFLNDELIEDTRDWYAQDKDGNVWYFGEDTKEYENGKVKTTQGSWEAGVDGAKAGIIMPGNPKVGDSYHQEYYKDIAEDMGDIVAFGKTIMVPYGTFKNCLQTRDWSKTEKSLNEYKYYSQDVGFVVLEESVKGGQEKVELIDVKNN